MPKPIFRRLTTRSMTVNRQFQTSSINQRSQSFFTPSNRPTAPHLSPAKSPQTQHRRYHYDPFLQLTSPLVSGAIVWGFIATCGFVFYKWQTSPNSSSSSPSPVNIKPWREFNTSNRNSHSKNGVSEFKLEELFKDMPSNFILSQANIDSGHPWTLLTHAISHQNTNHFLFNMISFHSFSKAAFWTGVRTPGFIGVCLGSAVAGGLASLADGKRKGQDRGGLGASGLISGLSAYVTCLAPKLRFGIIFIPIGIPLFILTPAFWAWDMYHLDNENSMTGHTAHLGGSAFGVVAFIIRKVMRI